MMKKMATETSETATTPAAAPMPAFAPTERPALEDPSSSEESLSESSLDLEPEALSESSSSRFASSSSASPASSVGAAPAAWGCQLVGHPDEGERDVQRQW